MSITIRVDDELRKKMREIKINWSEYIRDAIRRRIELEERRKAAERLLSDLKEGKRKVPSGFVNEAIKEGRER